MTLHDDDSASADSKLLSEIGSALSVEHGPAFGAGVHARIRRSRRRRVAVGGALALAASAILAVVFGAPGLQPRGGRPADVPPQVALAPTAVAPAPTFGAPAPTVGAPGLQPRGIAAPPAVARLARPASTVKAAPVAPEVAQEYVVVTNQLEILQGLWARQKGRPMQEATGVVADASETVSEPIAIAPVRVLPVVIGQSEGLPVGRTPIIRRAFAAAETR